MYSGKPISICFRKNSLINIGAMTSGFKPRIRLFSDVEQNVSGGETRYFEVRKMPIHDTTGAVIGTQVIFWDVSAHKRVEAELDQERQLLNALLANTPDNIYFKDQDGRFIRISRAKARRLGLNHPADAIGKTDLDFFSPEHAHRSRNDEAELMASGRSMESVEEQITWPDGTNTWVSTTKAPLRNYTGEIIWHVRYFSGHYQPQALRSGSAGSEGSRGSCQPRKRKFPGSHEPRDSYAHECDSGTDRSGTWKRT